ncbi:MULTISPECIES: hypothetical protein, partial [Acinetobacter]|uniref:hypothetical protein n=1 Tax=Acinetobacter TaxID=469 RepID=UPI001BC87C79
VVYNSIEISRFQLAVTNPSCFLFYWGKYICVLFLNIGQKRSTFSFPTKGQMVSSSPYKETLRDFSSDKF